MTRLVTRAFALVVFAVCVGSGAAQDRKAQQGSQPRDVETKQPVSERKYVDKATPNLMKVQVVDVNDGAKTFTGMLNGKPVTFHLSSGTPDHKAVTFRLRDLTSLPKGGIIDVRSDPPTSNLPTICGGTWVCHSTPPFSDYHCFCYGNL